MAFVAGLVVGYVMALLTLSVVMINHRPEISRLFPRVKFADTNTVKQQLGRIAGEALAAFENNSIIEHTDKEKLFETRPCSECKNFKESIYSMPICKKHLMVVSRYTRVAYKEKDGTCFEEN